MGLKGFLKLGFARQGKGAGRVLPAEGTIWELGGWEEACPEGNGMWKLAGGSSSMKPQ